MRKMESRQQGPPAKRRNWTRYWQRIVGLTWWLNVWKRKKNTNIIRWLSFSFFGRTWMSIFVFVFGHKCNFIFVGIFVYGWEWKMLFGRPLVYITKRSWSWDAKSWSWSWTLGLVLKEFWSLGLGIEIKVLVLILVLKKVLITSLVRSNSTVSTQL